MFFVLQCSFALAYSSDNIVIAQILGAAVVLAYAVLQKQFTFVSTTVATAITPLLIVACLSESPARLLLASKNFKIKSLIAV